MKQAEFFQHWNQEATSCLAPSQEATSWSALAQKVLFSRKKKIQIHPTVSLNNIQVESASHHKNIGFLLDEKLNFKQHINTTILKINKGISVTKKHRHSLPQKSLMLIYKAFLGPLNDYGDIIYDQPQNESFCEKLGSVQHKATWAITGAIQGTPPDKIHQELEFESLKSRRWHKRLSWWNEKWKRKLLII